MKTIGIRAEPSALTFVVFDTDANEILNAETMKIPTALTIPERLKYVRVNLLDILREYHIDQAGVRVTESNSQNLSIDRIQIEGVVLETFASSTLKKYYRGQISSISKLIGIERIDFKKYVDGEKNYDAVENWAQLSKVEREACLAAIGAVDA